jgi:uncharacterized protein YwqG
MRNYTVEQLMELIEYKPDVMLPRMFVLSWHLIETTKLPTIMLNASPGADLSLYQSKFGHYPLLPQEVDYPKDERDNYLFLLAQINFSEMPRLEGYPSSGYLQFYIANDDEYGFDPNDGTSQKNFRILFFEESEVTNPQTDFTFLDNAFDKNKVTNKKNEFSFFNDILNKDKLPFRGAYTLTFTPATDYVRFGDIRRGDKETFRITDLQEIYPALDEDDIMDAAYDHFKPLGHKIGGYAYFTTEDPRLWNEQYKDYLLLLQVDSEEGIRWKGDGVVNFFIHPNDLARKDFSKVLFNFGSY